MFRRRKKKQDITELPVAAGAENYRPGLFYFAGARAGLGSAWIGPKYWNGTRWRSDLLEVIAQIRAVVRANANLPAGLQAAAREHRRQLHHWTQRRIGLFFRAFWIPIVLLFIFLGMIANGNFQEATPVGYLFLFAGIFSVGYGVMSFYYAGTVEAVLLKLRDDLESGRQLSDSMRRMHRFFPPITADLVETGERTGQLAATLDDVSDELLDSARHRAGLGKFTIYFAFVAFIQFLLISFIAVKVFPVFVEISQEYGADAPWATEIFRSIQDLVVQTGPRELLYILIGIVGMIWLVRRIIRQLFTRPRAGFWFHIPFVAGLVRAQNLRAVGRLLAALLRAGMPLPEALHRVAQCHLSPAYRRALERVATQVENGTAFAEALQPEKRLFPEGCRALVQLGEHAGQLPEALEQSAGHYQRRHELAQYYGRALLVPLGVLLLGSVNLFVAMSAYELLTTLAVSIMEDL